MCMTLKQNGRERDEKIIAIHSIVPGDVISATEKGGGERGGITKRKEVGELARETNTERGCMGRKRDRQDGAEKLGI